jgi:hypothetical protein
MAHLRVGGTPLHTREVAGSNPAAPIVTLLQGGCWPAGSHLKVRKAFFNAVGPFVGSNGHCHEAAPG